MRFLSIYIHLYICASAPYVCMYICVYIYIYVAVFVHTSPGPKYGMECIKCRCSFVVCTFCLSLSLSRLFPCLCHSVAIASNILVVCHSCVGEVCVCRLLMLYMCTFVCFVPVWLLYTLHSFCKVCHGSYMYIDSFTNIYACARPHSFCTANTQTR